MKKYREIKFSLGTLESAVKELKCHSNLVYGIFNEQKLYSDIDDMDSAYKKVTGKTKAEFDEAAKQRQEEREIREKEHEESIPRLTKEWIEKGNAILDEKHHETWSECVPIRLGDLYKGMELGNCLEIVDQLNKGADLNEVKPLIENQGYSGMSFGLVCSMVKEFSDRGGEFVQFVR